MPSDSKIDALCCPIAQNFTYHRPACAGDTVTVHSTISSGRVVEKLDHDGKHCVRVELSSASQFGQSKIVGEALIAPP
jgi:acyl dehydratase